jgi:Restriction endonuclease S subunits
MNARSAFAEYVESDPLPPGWKWECLGDICRTTSGGTPSRKHDEYFHGDIPWVKSGELPDGAVTEVEERITEEAVENSSAKVFPTGTLLIALYGATVGKLGILQFAAATNQAVCAIFPPIYVDTKYLFWYLRFARSELVAQAIGGAQPNISQGILRSLRVPVAPPEVQKEIVAEIEKQFSRLDEAVANLKRVKANLKRYKAAVLKAAVEGRLVETEAELARREGDMFEPASSLVARTEIPPRPNRYSTKSADVIPGHAALSVGNTDGHLPEGWAWIPLVDVARMESGHTPSRNHPEWWDGDIPWIGIADARQAHGGVILDTEQHTNNDGIANSAARVLPEGTVCVSRTASVGYVVIMGRPMATSQDFVNWIPTEAVTSAWLRVVFTADREALIRFGKGSVHKTIYFPEWLSVHVAIPPRREQQRVVDEVDRRLSLAQGIESQIDMNLQRAERMRQAILSSAFSGEYGDARRSSM